MSGICNWIEEHKTHFDVADKSFKMVGYSAMLILTLGGTGNLGRFSEFARHAKKLRALPWIMFAVIFVPKAVSEGAQIASSDKSFDDRMLESVKLMGRLLVCNPALLSIAVSSTISTGALAEFTKSVHLAKFMPYVGATATSLACSFDLYGAGATSVKILKGKGEKKDLLALVDCTGDFIGTGMEEFFPLVTPVVWISSLVVSAGAHLILATQAPKNPEPIGGS